MNDDDLLEKELRMLKPGPLPEDLKGRLATEPSLIENHKSRAIVPWTILSVAAAVGVVSMVGILLNRVDPNEKKMATVDTPHLSILQKDSTLVNVRPLALKEHDGHVWEIAEEEWLDDTVALCSATPVQVHSTENRREIVFRPVEFQ